jgi:xanthine dehydrogenase YagT iron-sulfur-binding subunit
VRLEDEQRPPLSMAEITRREFVTTAGVITGGLACGIPVAARQQNLVGAASVTEVAEQAATGSVSLGLTVNGQEHHVNIDPRVTLLDLLREHLNLTGTKKGCDHGQCGACTVLANGRRINSCLSLALVHEGEQIITIEGLAHGEELHPLQAAFIEYDGFQCGYCTPGQICSAAALIEEARRGDASVVTADLTKTGPAELNVEEVRERMSGNICRCGSYPGIVQAVQFVSQTTAAENGSR